MEKEYYDWDDLPCPRRIKDNIWHRMAWIFHNFMHSLFCSVFNKPDVHHNLDSVNAVNSSFTCWFVSLFVGINIDWCMCCGAIPIPTWDVRNGVLVNVKGTCSIRSIFALNYRWNVEWNSILIHNFSMEWTRLEYCLAFRIHLIISPFNTEDLPSTKPLTYNWNILFEHCNATLRQVNIIVTYFDSLTPRNNNNNIYEAQSKSVGGFNLPYRDQLWLKWIARSMMRHNSVQR